MMLQQSTMQKSEIMTSMQHNKGSASLDSSKGRATVQVSAAMALKAESAIATVALRQVEKSEGGKEGSMMNESVVVLAQFSLTRAEVGSFRQLKTSTREKDYCACLFEQPQEIEGEDEDEEEDSSEISVTSGACETTLHQPIPRPARSTPTTTTSSALPVWPATNTTSCLTYPDSPQSQGSAMTTFGISSTSLSSQSPTRPPRHQRCRSSSFNTSEKQQSQQLRRRRFSPSRRPITAWLCLACGGPALELPQRWIKRISYSASTRLLRITICDSAFSSHEGLSWRSSYKSAMRCEDPTKGELGRVRTLDLCVSRLVEPREVNDLLARFPSELVSSSGTLSALPLSQSHQLHHLHHSSSWGGGGKECEASCTPSTDCSPKMSPLNMLSPCFSEDTVSLSSSGGGTPDHFSRPYHQHPQQQVLTEAATDLVMRQQYQQQQQQQRRDEIAPDDDTKDNRNCLGRVADDDRCFGTSTCKTISSSNDASASIMALLMMNQPRPVLSTPVVEEYHHPHFNHSQQQLYQEQQQQSQQFFAQRGVCPQSSTLGRDNAYNALIQGIETCRGRSANSRHYQHRRSESDSGDFAMYGSGGFHPLGFERQRAVQQQFNQSVRGKNPHGRHFKQQSQQQSQKQYIQPHHQYQQQQQGGGNGGLGQRRKDQRRFSTPHQQNNFNYNHQHRRQSFDILLSNSKDQHNVATPSPVVQETPTNSVSQTETAVVAEGILLQAPVFCRRRCISSGDFDPDPIAPIMPPSICSALRKRHARRMSCDGRLETYITSLSESDSCQSSEPSAVAATVKVTVSSRSNSHRLQQRQQQQHHFNQNHNQNQNQVNAGRTQQNCARGEIQGSSGLMSQSDVQYRAKRHSLTIFTDFPKDSLRDTSMSSVSDAGSDRRASISSSISDISISLSHSTTLSSSSSSTSLSSGGDNSICTRKGGPPVHYTLMCWIGGRWPCRLRPLIKKSTLNDIHVMLRRNLKLPPNYFIDIEFEWQGQTYMIMDATHWQWAREQVHDGDMAIRCKIWQKRFTR